MIAAPALSVLVVATAAALTSARRGERAAAVAERARREVEDRVTPPWFGRLLTGAELDIDAASAWPVARRASLALLVVLAFAAPLVAVGVAGCAAAAAVGTPIVRRHREAGAYDGELLAAVESLSASLATGASLGQALAAGVGRGGAVAADLGAVADRGDRGAPLQDALDGWAVSRPGTGVGLVVDALALAGTSGGSRSRALTGVAATLRERAALRGEVRALGSQARASAAVLVATPLAFSTVVAVVDPRIGAFLVGTGAGWACLVVGLGLDLAGAGWMARLLRGVR